MSETVLDVRDDVVLVRQPGRPEREHPLRTGEDATPLLVVGALPRVRVLAGSVTAVRRLAAVLAPTVATRACVVQVRTSQHVARRRRGRWAYGAGEVAAAWEPVVDDQHGGRAVLTLEHRVGTPRRLQVLLEDLLRCVVPAPPRSADGEVAVDQALLSPAGFAAATAGVGHLRAADGEHGVDRAAGGGLRVEVDGEVAASWVGERRPDDGDVVRLRGAAGCVVEWPADGGAPVAGVARRWVETVAALACAGVPLAADPVPGWAADPLGTEVVAALRAARPDRWDEPLSREEDSVRLRRAALQRFCRPAPSEVSVLAATRRPEMVAHLLGEVRRQRGPRVELVLALHGMPASHPQVVQALAAHDAAVQVVEAPDATPFGSVLQRAVGLASCDVLTKMDDDDWYGEHHLADMLLALHVSGADLVGCSPDFVHLTAFGTTVRRRTASEVLTRFVAGGTLTLRRETLAAVGGFRPVAGGQEDSGLIDDVLADTGAVYRTHGLGYVMRRGPRGHTWQASTRFYLSAPHDQAPGLVGSRAMGPDWEGAASSEAAPWREGLLASRSDGGAEGDGGDGEARLRADLAATGVVRLRLVVDGPDGHDPEVAVDVRAPRGGDGELLVDGARYGRTAG